MSRARRLWRATWVSLVLAAAALGPACTSRAAAPLPELPTEDAERVGSTEVRGITVSTPTWGWEWGTPAMDRTLDSLDEVGANWVATHPYARVHRDGRITWRPIDPEDPPAWLVRPVDEAHRRGLQVLIKPHLAYWGSGFSWRGEIDFEDPAVKRRFFDDYRRWTVEVAAATRHADAFVVGTELDRLATPAEDAEWRRIIAEVRAVHPGHLTYAANWDAYEQVPFWDALDAIGVQAYFPLVRAGEPTTPATVRAGWARVCKDLRRLSERTGKPVVFTELGYDASPNAAREPWKSGHGGEEVQRLVLDEALRMLQHEEAIVGAFLWKWFPDDLQRGDYRMSRPDLRAITRRRWKAGEEGEVGQPGG